MSLSDKVRVMTLQEVFRTKNAVVCEFRYGINPGTFQLKDIVRWLKQKREYGKTWRCWTHMPGDLLRLNTPWKEEK